MNMSLAYWIMFAQHGLKNSNLTMFEFISAFATHTWFCSLNYNFTQWATKFHHVLSFTSSLAAAWVNSYLICFFLICKAVCKWAKMWTIASVRIPLLLRRFETGRFGEAKNGSPQLPPFPFPDSHPFSPVLPLPSPFLLLDRPRPT